MGKGYIFGNKILDIVFVSMLIAQTLKVIIYFFKEKKLNFKKYLDTGSMPSSHTASVVSLATAVGISEGINSSLFAICVVFATIVMFDSTGVRQAVGKQAVVLNKILENISQKNDSRIIGENLKELMGHTPLEVFGGAILGMIVAFLMY